VADVDGDGRDEIIYGACTIDDNGRGLYTSGLGHGDALHVGDLNPNRPGLLCFSFEYIYPAYTADGFKIAFHISYFLDSDKESLRKSSARSNHFFLCTGLRSFP